MASTELITESMPYLVITVANPNYSNVLVEHPLPERLSNGVKFIFLKTWEYLHIHTKKSWGWGSSLNVKLI